MSYKATRPLVAPPDAESIQTTSVPAAEFPAWLARQRATINWQRHKIAGPSNRPSNPGTRLKGQRRRVMLEKYICNCAGSPRPVAESMRKRIRESSIKCGCTAAITVSHDRDDPRIYHIKMTPHTNHNPYSSEYLLRSRLSTPAQLWLSDAVSKGLEWSTLKKMMQLSAEEAETIGELGSSPTVPEVLRVKYQDVYNKVRQHILFQSRLAAAARDSVIAWIERLRADGWHAEFRENIRDDAGRPTWAVFLCSTWQSQVLQQCGRLVMMDSTHNTCYAMDDRHAKVYLFSLVVKHSRAGKGVPVAWMLTPHETRYPIIDWLRWVRSSVPSFAPETFVLDCSDTEASAVRLAFADASAQPQVQLCTWHMFKAVRKASAEKVSCPQQPGENPLALTTRKKALAAELFRTFLTLQEAESPVVFEQRLARMTQEFGTTQKGWINYILSYGVRKKENWSRAWVKVTHHAITTNNYIESWHKVLKYHYIGRGQRQRTDQLIHTLTMNAEPAYRQDVSLIITGFVRRRSSKAETQRQNAAQSIEWSRANAMVTEMDDDGDIYVTSFGEDEQGDGDSTFIETSYTVGLHPTDSKMISTCDCPDFIRHMFPCKHMWLAARVTRRRVDLCTSDHAPLASQASSHVSKASPSLPPSSLSLPPPLQAIPNNTAEHEDQIQLYRRLAEEAGRVHAKLLRTLQELEGDDCDPLTRLADSGMAEAFIEAGKSVTEGYSTWGAKQRRV